MRIPKKHSKAIAEIIKGAKEDLRGGTPAEHVLYILESRIAGLFTATDCYFDGCEFLKIADIEADVIS